LLGIITLFITGYILAAKYISLNKFTTAGLTVFVIGVIFNEALLMTQGIADISYQGVPFINSLLLLASLILFAGLLLVNYGIRKPGLSAGNIPI